MNWIRNDQLFDQGIDEDGNVIGYYSFVSEVINPEKMEGTPYTLYDSGDFYRSMFITVMTDATFVIDADAIKSTKMAQKISFKNMVTALLDWPREVVKNWRSNVSRDSMKWPERYYNGIDDIPLYNWIKVNERNPCC